MHALLSALFGAFLTLLVFGFSFIAPATLRQDVGLDEVMEQTSENPADNHEGAVT